MTSDRANITSGLSNRARRALAVFAAAGLATATLGIAAVAQTIAPGTTIPRITPISPLGVGSTADDRAATARHAAAPGRDDDADAHAENAGTDPNDHDHIDGDTDQQHRHPNRHADEQYRSADARRIRWRRLAFLDGCKSGVQFVPQLRGFWRTAVHARAAHGREVDRRRRRSAAEERSEKRGEEGGAERRCHNRCGEQLRAGRDHHRGRRRRHRGAGDCAGATSSSDARGIAEFSADRRDHVPLAHSGQPLDRCRFAPAAGRRQRPLGAAQLPLHAAAGRDCEGRSRASMRSTSSISRKRMR